MTNAEGPMTKLGKGLKVVLIVVVIVAAVLAITVALAVKYSNQIIKGELERRLGKEFSIERVDLTWGHVEAVGVTLKNQSGKEVIKVGGLSASADFMGLIRGKYVVSLLTIKDPYLFLEIDSKGNIVNPVLPKELTSGEEAASDKKPERPVPPVIIKKMQVINGSIDYMDRKTPVVPVLTKIRTVDFTINDVSLPFADIFSTYILNASIPGTLGTGKIESEGKVKIKTKDMDIKANVHGLDITAFKPYFQKESPVDVTKGFLNLTMNAKVVSEKLNAPGTVVLKDLDFQSGPGAKAKFLGVPLSLVVALLKKNNDEISVNFVMKGDLNNPKFDLKESFMDKLSIGMADKLGLSLKGITESVIGTGSRGAGDLDTAVKNVGESLKKLYKK
jgi:hypothetical protein